MPGGAARAAGLSAKENAAPKDGVSKSRKAAKGLLALRLQDLLAAVHAALQVHMVGTVKLARIRVLDIGRLLQRIGRTAHAALRRGGFPLGDGHGLRSDCSASGPLSADACLAKKALKTKYWP